MKIRHPLLIKTTGLAAASLIRAYMATLDYRIAYYDPTVDAVHPDFSGQKIYVLWHELMLGPMHMRAHCDLALLASQHLDAEILGHVAHHFGFSIVRGSTRRGGAAALQELRELGQYKSLVITPDGPRGPRRQMAQGAVYLSSRLGLPIVCMGLGCDRPWRLKSWDRFAIPRPWSRFRAVISPAITLPADLNRAGVEHYRAEVERMLNRLTLEAEAWAESGTSKLEEQPARSEHRAASHVRRRFDAPHEGHRPFHDWANAA